MASAISRKEAFWFNIVSMIMRSSKVKCFLLAMSVPPSLPGHSNISITCGEERFVKVNAIEMFAKVSVK